MGAYTIMAGADPPVVRGAMMGSAWIIATLFGRRSSALVTLALVAAVMAALRPAILTDVSFQLSFAATGGLVLLAGPLASRLRNLLGVPEAPPGPASALIDVGAVTAAATLATLPLVAIHFGRISLIALPANLVLVPLFVVILAFSVATAVLSGLWAPLAAVTAPFAWLSLTAMVHVVRFFARLPFAAAEIGGVEVWHTVIMYLVLGAAAWWLRTRRQRTDSEERVAHRRLAIGWRPVLAALAGSGTAILLFVTTAAISSNGNEQFEVRFLDVGQGDAALLRSPQGRTVLIDGGPDGLRLARELGEALPPRHRSLDLVVVTHADSDHSLGLVEVLRRFDVGALLVPERGSGSPFTALLADARVRGIPVRIGRAGEQFAFDGATLDVLAPTNPYRRNENDAGIAVRFRFGAADVLFAADLEQAGEADLARAFPSADVLKVAHHGSKTSSTADFLQAVRPQVAIVSVGEDNRYGHPNPEVIARLEAATQHVYRTDRDGTVRLKTDGRRLWFRAER